MNIQIYTQIFPRLEVFFLDEWIQYHLNQGVRRIHLYDNGLHSADSENDMTGAVNLRTLRQEERGVKWRKKPDADYFLDFSNSQIYNELDKIVRKYPEEVTLTTWRTGKECKECQRVWCQLAGYQHCQNNNEADWWIHIDPDEYLVSENHKDVQNFLAACEMAGDHSVHIGQRVFEARRRDVPVKSLFLWGYDALDIKKSIIKSPAKVFTTKRLGGIHQQYSQTGETCEPGINDLRINHYRGLGAGTMHLKYIEGCKFDKEDRWMEKHL